MKQGVNFFKAAVAGFLIFHAGDLLMRFISLMKARTVTITTKNFIYSPAKPVLVLAILMLIALIVCFKYLSLMERNLSPIS